MSWCRSRSTRVRRWCSTPPSPASPARSSSSPTSSSPRTRSASADRTEPAPAGDSKREVGKMSLYKRLHEVQGGGAAGGGRRRDPVLDELRQKIHHHLIDELGPILYDKRLSEEDLRRRVHEQLHAALAQERAPLSAADKAQLIQDVSDDILGYGPIDRLLKDEDITEVMVNGPESVYVEKSGKLTKTGASFVDETHLRRI